MTIHSIKMMQNTLARFVLAFAPVTMVLLVPCQVILAQAEAFPSDASPFPGESEEQAERVQFSFEKADWKDVIPWFAEQTNYSWQPISEFPEGTFTLKSDRKYTPIEALDQLNYSLRLQQPPYTIIRNRDQLILTEASSVLPLELIPQVAPEDLDLRGDYEIISCQFQLGEINVESVERDLMASVSGNYAKSAKVLPASNEFYARGTGADLKKIRDTIAKMAMRQTSSYTTYSLKHYDPEQFLLVARRLLGIPEDSYESKDKSLVIVVDPSSNRMIVKGTPAAVANFEGVAKVVDVAANVTEAGVERSYLKSYPVFTDAKMTLKVVETMLDGTNATIGQDDTTGAIVLRGTESHHKVAVETIEKLKGENGSSEIVELQNGSASDILTAVSSLLNLSAVVDNPNAPKLLANTLQNYIVVRGKPAEIFEITQIIKQLDQAQGRDPNQVRTNARVIEMSPGKRDEVLDSVQDYWPSSGRRNILRIIMPDERIQDKLEEERLLRDAFPGEARRRPSNPLRSPQAAASSPQFYNVAYQQTASAPQDVDQAESASNRYNSPPAMRSVPGDDIVIKATPFGVLIESDDLDALDDLEDILRNQSLDDGIDQGLNIFYLKFRKATLVKPALEDLFGLSSDGGGGGGGGLLPGIVDNVAGGGAGDLLGGLLGGSGFDDSSAGAISLTGDVQIGLYVPLNLVYVSGATATDLSYVQEAITMFDQPSPPQDPELAGQLYTISVNHRSPEEVIDLIRSLMSEYIDGGNEAAAAGGGNARGGEELRQVANAMRGLAGGGGGGKQAAGADQELPKARVELDAKTGQILITGPEFIYRQILELVERIDTPDLSEPKSFEVLPAEYFSPSAMEILQSVYGNSLRIGTAEEVAKENEATRSPAASGSGGSSQSQQQNQRQGVDALRNLERNLQRQQGGGQRGGGGGGQRGGGQRGGGGGGQRGGGGRGR